MSELTFSQRQDLKTIQEFDSELKQLLKKYDAEIRAEDEFSGYAECGEDIQISISFNVISGCAKYGDCIDNESKPEIKF